METCEPQENISSVWFHSWWYSFVLLALVPAWTSNYKFMLPICYSIHLPALPSVSNMFVYTLEIFFKSFSNLLEHLSGYHIKGGDFGHNTSLDIRIIAPNVSCSAPHLMPCFTLFCFGCVISSWRIYITYLSVFHRVALVTSLVPIGLPQHHWSYPDR